jgi:hypothetical protein
MQRLKPDGNLPHPESRHRSNERYGAHEACFNISILMPTSSVSQNTIKSWHIIDTLGPVFSNYGFKNWDLCLAEDAIIAFPRSFWLTVKTGIAAGLGTPLLSHVIMQRMWAKSSDMEGKRILQDSGDAAWRRYPVAQLQSIVCKRAIMSANEIVIQRKNAKPDLYGLGDRSQTDSCRNTLRKVYGSLYCEEKF